MRPGALFLLHQLRGRVPRGLAHRAAAGEESDVIPIRQHDSDASGRTAVWMADVCRGDPHGLQNRIGTI